MQTLWVDPYNGLKTHQNDIIFDRGMSFEAACRKLEHEKGADDSSGFRRSRRPIFGKTMFLLALQKVGTPGVFSICRPNTGTSFFDMEVGLLSHVSTHNSGQMPFSEVVTDQSALVTAKGCYSVFISPPNTESVCVGCPGAVYMDAQKQSNDVPVAIVVCKLDGMVRKDGLLLWAG